MEDKGETKSHMLSKAIWLSSIAKVNLISGTDIQANVN